ncbi:hypothetical protein PHYNN_169 [Pantoea phage Phynn]|nr:hypothetical protein PHYNN_169 [Pantoea phage Phynn]
MIRQMEPIHSYYIRRNMDIANAIHYDNLEEAVSKFNQIVDSPVYYSGQHRNDLWELVAKESNSKIILRSAIKTSESRSERIPEAGEIFTCIGKGGQYKIIGLSKGAGTSRFSNYIVYQDSTSGEIYHRTLADFFSRMEIVK